MKFNVYLGAKWLGSFFADCGVDAMILAIQKRLHIKDEGAAFDFFTAHEYEFNAKVA